MTIGDPSETLSLEALHRVGLLVSAELKFDRLLQLIVEQAARLLDGSAGGFHRFDPVRDLLIWAASYGDTSSLPDSALHRGEGVIGQVLQTWAPAWIGPGDVVSFPSDGGATFSLTRSLVAVPVTCGQERIGVLNVWIDPPRQVLAGDVQLLHFFANQAGVAIRNATLVQALQDSQATLRRYAQELRAQNEELDAFAHTVAHDLKNPLANLSIFIQILEESGTSFTPEELETGIQAMARNVRKAISIVDELLLLASIRKEDVTRSALNMRPIVEEACRQLIDTPEDKDARIDIQEEWPIAIGYAPWVEQVWINLLSNALKYGGKPPLVEVGAEAAENRMVRFWVKDHGPGISAEQQSRLFLPFTRLDKASTQGSGLGLSIVRRIVEKLGGTVGAESDGVPGHGSTFSFTLPAYGERQP